MKIQALFIALAFTTLFLACSKIKLIVKELKGTWGVTEVTINGVPEDIADYENTQYIYEKCGKAADCKGSINENSLSIPFTYSIENKGKQYVQVTNFLGFVFTTTADIIEHSETKFVFSYTDVDGLVVTTLEKK